MEIIFQSFLLFSLSKSDASNSKNNNTLENCFIIQTELVKLIESDTATAFSCLLLALNQSIA